MAPADVPSATCVGGPTDELDATLDRAMAADAGTVADTTTAPDTNSDTVADVGGDAAQDDLDRDVLTPTDTSGARVGRRRRRRGSAATSDMPDVTPASSLARRDPLRRPTELAREALATILDEATLDRSRGAVDRLTIAMTMPDGVVIELRAELGDR